LIFWNKNLNPAIAGFFIKFKVPKKRFFLFMFMTIAIFSEKIRGNEFFKKSNSIS